MLTLIRQYRAYWSPRRVLFAVVSLAGTACAFPPKPPAAHQTFQSNFANRKIEAFDGNIKTCLFSTYNGDPEKEADSCFKRLGGDQVTVKGICPIDHLLGDESDELQLRWIGRIETDAAVTFPKFVILKIKAATKLYGNETEIRDVDGVKFVARTDQIMQSESELTACD